MNNENKLLNEELGFHMEPLTDETHSLIQSEIEADLERKKREAQIAEIEFRKRYIIALLEHNNINPSEVDIDSIINGNIPSWFDTLDRNIQVNLFEKKNKTR